MISLMSRFSKYLFLIALSIFFLLPNYSYGSNRTLYLGLSGDDVVRLQNALISNGYLSVGKNTGYFGALTESALKKLQCDKNIICENATVAGYGVFGPKTRVILQTGSSSSDNNSSPNSLSHFEYSGWIPYWKTASGTEDVTPHLDKLTSVMPFGFSVKNNGKLSDTAKITKEPWTSFIAEAKRKKVRVIPTVMWGNGNTIHKILSNTKTRIALEDEIADMVKKNNFDGIDIDFEAKKHETLNYFSTFLKGLYQRMGNKWIYCTIEARMPIEDRYPNGAKVPPDAMDYANDYVEMNKYCDRVEIMAYDQGTIDIKLNNARKAPYAPVADPSWAEALVTLAAKDIDKRKIIIGVPTYGYEYEVAPLANGGYKYKVLWPFNLKYATDIAGKLGITPTRTSANEIGFVYDPKKLLAIAPTENDSTKTQQETATTSVAENAGTEVNSLQPFNFLSWSDAVAIADKVALAKKLGVRGVAVFKFDGGEDQKIWDILK